jgi:prepilin-type N-terminal cleavage/methylation domain-containing protein
MQKFINRGHAQAGFTLIELLVVIAIIGILAGIVLASLGSARSGAADAKIKEQLSSMRSAMESYYATNGNYGASQTADGCTTAPSVAPWNNSATGMLALANDNNYANGVTCATTGTGWAAEALLSTANTYFCVDSSGAATTTVGSSISAVATVNVVCGPL